MRPLVIARGETPKQSHLDYLSLLAVHLFSMNPKMQYPPEWNRTAEEILSKARTAVCKDSTPGGLTMLLGATDVGKTTFAKFLIERSYSEGLRIAYIDADIGQKTVWLPTTVSLAFIVRISGDMSDIKPDVSYFVGDTSPLGHTLEIVSGLRRLSDEALKMGADAILLDTTGLVWGDHAMRLKSHKIDMLSPDYIVAFQREDEVEHILRPYDKRGDMKIIRLSVSPDVSKRSMERRKAHREGKFGRYFKDARTVEFERKEVQITGTPLSFGGGLSANDLNFLSDTLDTRVVYAEKDVRCLFIVVSSDYSKDEIYRIEARFGQSICIVDKSDLEGLIVGLNDGHDRTLAVGIIEEIDFEEGRLWVKSPIENRVEVKLIRSGFMRLSKLGQEIGRFSICK